MREAIVALTDEELETIGFTGLVETVREAGIRDIEMLEDQGTSCVPQVELAEPVDVDTVENYECVEDCELVARRGDAHVYVFELTAPGLPEEMERDHEDLLGVCDPTVSERGVVLSLVGSQSAIREVLCDFQSAGATPDLHRLTEYDGGTAASDSLTQRQREVLETAFELGFYEVPREASTADVAGELGIDPATASEHLQRAERNLLASRLAP